MKKVNEFGCEFAKCVTSGDGFEEGVLYPILGWNNGVNIVREGDQGDPYVFVACTGGIGKGDYNNYDGTGTPSFEHEVKR